ncbi:MAG: HEAT repeat domain-containing protein [Planctomycetes bacterium]|nr:HEAT repeat domain-containing protein [Planctomycetota bacterium]
MADDVAPPRAESGVLVVGGWSEAARAFALERWPFAREVELAPGVTRLDLSGAAPGDHPGFTDGPGLAMLSVVGAQGGGPVVGYFCDADLRAEGARVFEAGQERDRRRVEWARAGAPPEGGRPVVPPDPIAWPVAATAVSLGLPVEALTRVPRPPRPPLALAVEALLNGEAPATAELRHQALQLLGGMDHPRVTALLVEHLRSDDWVARFHAVRAYARRPRAPGQEGRPPLDALLQDEDEGVRESALRGIAELLPEVAFSDRDLQAQIDAAIGKGLADADDDVRAAAEEARALRVKLLG